MKLAPAQQQSSTVVLIISHYTYQANRHTYQVSFAGKGSFVDISVLSYVLCIMIGLKRFAWRLVICAFVCLVGLTAAQNVYAQNKDSLLQQLRSAKHDTQRIYILRSLTSLEDDTTIRRYFDEGIALCKKALSEDKEPREFYTSSLATIYSNMGQYYKHRSEYSYALKQYYYALQAAEPDDRKFRSTVLNNIAILYDDMGDMRKSLEVSYLDLKLQEELKDSIGIAYSYNNIAHIFAELKDGKNALDYYTRSLNMFRAIKSERGMAMILGNTGTYYSDQKDYKTALDYYKRSLALYRQMDDVYYTGEVLSCCGFALDKLGEEDSALGYFNGALAIAKQLDVKENMAYAYTAMARIMLKKGNTTQAQQYALLSLELSRQLGGLRNIQNSARVLKDIFVRTGNYEEAYTMHALEIQMRDSISNEANYKDAISKKLQYDYDKKELELKLDNEKRIWEKNVAIYSCLFVALVVVLGSLFYARHNKLKSRLERMELEQQQYRAQMNPHFIFNCLHSIQHYILHNDVISANRYLSEFASLMRTTMEYNQLYTIVLQQEIDYLNSYLTLEQMRFENKFTYQVTCGADVDTHDIQVLPTLIQPFAENAIVHGLCYLEKDGRLLIDFKKEGAHLVCTVEDNGIGRRASQDIKARTGKKHRSQGMELVKKRLALASSLTKSTFSVEVTDKTDADGKATGTLVILKFPLDV